MWRWPSPGALLVTLAGVAPPPRAAAAAPVYHVRAESRLVLDRWRGATPDPVERTDVRQRLTLGVFGIGRGPAADDGPHVSFHGDLEIGADLGPDRALQRALPVDRRARFDLFHAFLRIDAAPVEVRAGRHLLADALGYDALDGVTARLAVAPFLGVEASGGFAVRRGWSTFGPDVFTVDGTELPDRAGHVLGVAVFTRELTVLQARAAWRRVFDDAVQREEAGVSATVRPWAPLHVTGGLRYDVVFRRLVEVSAGAGLRLGEIATLEAGWRRDRPTFSADSIWNAFGGEPYDEVHGRIDGAFARWHLSADGGMRFFRTGGAGLQAPGLTPAEREAAALDPPETVRRSPEAGLRVVRRLGDGSDAAHVGVEGRLATGWGGERTYGDVFAAVPWVVEPGARPAVITGRVGAVRFAREGEAAVPSGWALLSARWPVAETIALEIVGEGFVDDRSPGRVRLMGRLAVEEWL